MDMIRFNKPYISGNELKYIQEACEIGKLTGDGKFTKRCHEIFKERYGFRNVFLTTSCTDALEMASILADIQPGDEVIVPSYTFVSSANPFVLRGATIRFADSMADDPNISVEEIRRLANPRTKAIVVVHYAGVACDMDPIMEIAAANDAVVIEDCAQAIDSYYKGKPLGSIGHYAAFSFHETKNIISGEGGMLVVNNDDAARRAEIIREKGTNRSAFFRGEIDKYGWVDVGSSFLPSDMIAAFLQAQLESLEDIQKRRVEVWNGYHERLAGLRESGHIMVPELPDFATNNAHMYFLVCRSDEERAGLLAHLKSRDVNAVFHYLSLHRSTYFEEKYEGPELPNADMFSSRLVRLPFFYELTDADQDLICELIHEFYNKH